LQLVPWLILGAAAVVSCIQPGAWQSPCRVFGYVVYTRCVRYVSNPGAHLAGRWLLCGGSGTE